MDLETRQAPEADPGRPGRIEALARRLRREIGDLGVLTDRQELRTYECDGLAVYKVVPALVALPGTAQQVGAVVRACVEAGVPFVARGAGTGLSGGALPHADGVLVVTSKCAASSTSTSRTSAPSSSRA